SAPPQSSRSGEGAYGHAPGAGPSDSYGDDGLGPGMGPIDPPPAAVTPQGDPNDFTPQGVVPEGEVPDWTQICFHWNPDYIDEGYGEGSGGLVPAAFAEYHLRVVGPIEREQGTELTVGLLWDPNVGPPDGAIGTPGILG